MEASDLPAKPEDADVTRGVPVGRRVILAMAGLGAAGVVFGSKVQDFLERVTGPITARDGTGLSSLLPTGRFRIYTVTGDLPSKSDAAYRLKVTGSVAQPLDLTLADLKAMPPALLTKDFQCVTGWRVHDVKWRGVRLADLLDRAGADLTKGGIEFTSFDGAYTESLSMIQARRADVIVAYEMEGKPISSIHGGPARLYAAPMYGYKSCKWLQEISVVAQPRAGYWEDRGYDVDAWIGRSNGRGDQPV